MDYEIVAKSGKRDSVAGLDDVQVFVRANNKYYLFQSQDGVTIMKPMILDQNANIPLGNWFFVEEFEADDYFKLPEFVEAIDTYFMNN